MLFVSWYVIGGISRTSFTDIKPYYYRVSNILKLTTHIFLPKILTNASPGSEANGRSRTIDDPIVCLLGGLIWIIDSKSRSLLPPN